MPSQLASQLVCSGVLKRTIQRSAAASGDAIKSALIRRGARPWHPDAGSNSESLTFDFPCRMMRDVDRK